MARIIPAILVQNEDDFRKQVSLAAAFAPMIQIDVLDGTMLPERAWNNARAAAAMRLSIPFEVHLMVNDPELKVPAWIKSGARRIIVHAEAKGKIGLALEMTKLADRIAGLAISPDTDLSVAKEWAPFVHHFQIMGVHPGGQGRPFDPETPSRVRALKKMFPHITVAVDGGVNDFGHLTRELAAAGADDLVVGSSLWRSPNPAQAYREMAADASI